LTYTTQLAESHLNLGTVLGQAGQQPLAIEALSRGVTILGAARRVAPGNLKLSRSLALAYNNLGYMQRKIDPVQAETSTRLAIELLEQVRISAPELEHVFTNLGLAYFKQKNYDNAELAFQQAIDSNPNDAIAYNHLGIIKRLQGEFDSARQTYQKAIQIDNRYASAYLNLGILYDIYLQDLEKALQQYKKYQALTSDESNSVGKWIVDIQRQLKTAKTSTQG
jgi:tetratricopeptide (TPR) repeat protein